MQTLPLNMTALFAAIKKPLFGGKFAQETVDGLNDLKLAFDQHGSGDPRHFANILGQVYHESVFTMAPQKEQYNGSPESYFAKYGTGSLAVRLGNKSVADGVKYFGRGQIQITGRGNYQKFSDILGVDLINKPDQALDPSISSRIAVIGMTQGKFTGKKLSDYLNDKVTDWAQCRRIVNGMDKADKIATYSKQFYAAIQAATITTVLTASSKTEATSALSAVMGGDKFPTVAVANAAPTPTIPVVPPPEPPAPTAAQRPTTYVQTGQILAGSLVAIPAAINLVSTTVSQVHDAAGQVVTTITTAKDTAGQLSSMLLFPPWLIVIVGAAIVAMAGYTLWHRAKVAREQGV